MDRPPRDDRRGGLLPARRKGGAFASVERQALARRASPAILAAAGALAYAWLAPRTGDLPAHVYRAGLFGAQGFTVWNGQWYSGHHTPAYSVLFPPLAWALGPWRAGAVAAVAAAALFEPLARRHFGERAWIGSVLFAVGTTATLFAGRLTYVLGVALALAALLALQRGRVVLAGALAATSAMASPVAGLFLALVGLVAALAGPRRGGVVVVAASLLPPGLLTLAFPEGGSQPFVLSSFVLVPLFAAVALLVLPRAQRALSIAIALYALATLASFLVPTPMGGNAVRLGQLAGPAVMACALVASRPPRARLAAGATLVAGLLAWQVVPAARDVSGALGDPSARPGYFTPLLSFLERQGPVAWRVEIPFTRDHWEAAAVAPRFPIARGWLRSTDIARNPVLYRDPLTDDAYAAWLRDHAVRFVALADAPADPSARQEAALVARGPAYLGPPRRVGPWRVYEVRHPAPLVEPIGPVEVELRALGSERLLLDFRRPGAALVRVSSSPYWRVDHGCVSRQGRWTLVSSRRAGRQRLWIDFSARRIVDRGPRCDPGDG